MMVVLLCVQVWRDCLVSKAKSPYLTHMLPLGGIKSLRFCPYEDVLGVGCAGGISSLLIPGAGEPNFDSFVANPFQSKKERQEQEVVQLLDKLQPDTIMLDPDAVGKVGRLSQLRGPHLNLMHPWIACCGHVWCMLMCSRTTIHTQQHLQHVCQRNMWTSCSTQAAKGTEA